MSSSLRIKTNVRKEGLVPEEVEPMTPTGRYLNSSVLSCTILAVFETETPMVDDLSPKTFAGVILSFNPRFSSIMIKDENGIPIQWKRVQVNVEDHIKIPLLPPGLSIESYDKHFDDYLTQISVEEFAEDHPLWELHVFRYPTSHAPGTCIVKIHHALGDGYSLIGAILSTFQRADDPSKALTFPASKNTPAPKSQINNPTRNFFSLMFRILVAVWYGLLDMVFSMSKIYVQDDITPIRSGDVAVQYKPTQISTVSLSLDQIKQIKSKLGVTINDVLVGTIWLAANLYNQQMSQGLMRGKRSTMLVPINIRAAKGYKPIEEMNKKQSESPWGNHVMLLLIPIPNVAEKIESVNPLDFVFDAHKTIKRKRTTYGVLFFALILKTIRRFGGFEVAARYFHQMFNNSSLAITNLIGPVEQMSVANHPIKGFYFMLVGVPQSLKVTVLSYMQTVRIGLGVEDRYIDKERLTQCVENAFELISRAALSPTQ